MAAISAQTGSPGGTYELSPRRELGAAVINASQMGSQPLAFAVGVAAAAVLALGLPHLVAVRDGNVVGYAYAGNWRPRPAYKYSVEDSIYIDNSAVGQGVGKALLPVLIEHCTALGKRQMVAVIGDSAQTASIRLHASCGFEMVGTLKNIGFKFGRWLDSVLMQRALGSSDAPPPGSR